MEIDLADLAEIQGALYRADFGMFCEAALAPINQKPAAHHKMLIRKLQAVADGKIKRLMILMPPGSAKTTYVSQLFTVWWLARFPRSTIIAASHTADLAETISRKIQINIRDMGDVLGYDLATESVSGWTTSAGGEYKPAGVGGPITGRRANLALIDDPVKNADAVATEAAREKTWDWFVTTLRTRMTPGAPLILVMTRWHMDDLGGRMLTRQGEAWDVLRLPAQAEENDPLGRQPGEFLWGDDTYNYAADLKAAKAESEVNGSMRVWEAMYQQNPRPIEGSLFKYEKVGNPLPAAPATGQSVRGWDLASTSQSGRNDPDWTVGVKLTRMPNGEFVVADVERFRGGPDEVEERIVACARKDGAGCRIGLPLDPGQASKTQILYLTRKLAGFRVESSPETGKKEIRASPVAAQCNVGNLRMVQASWNASFLDELSAFPHGQKDDQVDALSRAFSMVGLSARPLIFSDADLAMI